MGITSEAEAQYGQFIWKQKPISIKYFTILIMNCPYFQTHAIETIAIECQQEIHQKTMAQTYKLHFNFIFVGKNDSSPEKLHSNGGATSLTVVVSLINIILFSGILGSTLVRPKTSSVIRNRYSLVNGWWFAHARFRCNVIRRPIVVSVFELYAIKCIALFKALSSLSMVFKHSLLLHGLCESVSIWNEKFDQF